MALTVYSKEKDKQNNQGIWTEFKGSKLRIAAWLNVSFVSKFLSENKEVPSLETGDERIRKYVVLSNAMAGTILTSWENVRDDETGEEVKFTEELAAILLRNDLVTHNFVKSFSQEMLVEKENKDEKIAGEL